MSKFQIAGKPGHRASEHLYVLKSVFAHYQSKNKGLLVTSFDLKRFFDSEDIFDCFNEIYRSQVKGKVYRLLFEMNKNTRIRIKTPVGETQARDTGPIVTQGGTEGPVLSSVSVDNGLNVTFVRSEVEVKYKTLALAPQSFMDDIMRMAESLKSAQFGNNLMEEVIEQKCLQFNLDKSCFVIMGNKKQRKKFEKDLEKSPLTLCNQKMKEVKLLKFLGDYVSYNLQNSIHQTVLKRVGIAKQTVLEIRTVVEDIRADKLGSVNVAFNIFEQAIVPMITHNSETWMFIGRKTIKVLDDLFLFFCRTIFRVGVGCPKTSFYWESAFTKFENLILEKKLNFVFHLANLPITSLGRQIFDIQDEDRTLPSLLLEVQDHLDAIGLNIREVSKWQFKQKTRKYIKSLNRKQLLEEIRKYKKLNYEELSNAPYERKSYFSNLNLPKARMRFRVASSFVQTIRGNFSRKYQKKSLACPGCFNVELDSPVPTQPDMSASNQSQPSTSQVTGTSNQSRRDSQSHVLLVCPAYSDIRSSIELDPMDDEKLAEFFTQVVQRRIDNGED